jgi:hypothetical protein
MADEDNPRQEFEFKIAVKGSADKTIRMIDRINVDDVFRHLVDRELYRLVTKKDQGDEVNQYFKDALLKERFTAGQN